MNKKKKEKFIVIVINTNRLNLAIALYMPCRDIAELPFRLQKIAVFIHADIDDE